MTENEVKKTIEIDAPPEVVFKALTNIEDLTQWFPDKGIFEPKVGGKMRFTFYASPRMDRDHLLEGEIVEFVPNKKLSYTFIADKTYLPDGKPVPDTLVTWNLEEISKNKTKVTLVHSGFTKDMVNMFKEVTAGWGHFVPRLVQYCKGKSKN